jgi:hypothetical protein
MRQLQGSKYILFALLACMAVTISSAAIADQELLSLVPPGAQGVTRIGSPNPSALVGHFVLTSRNNGIDYNDFLALTGADGTLVVHELIYVVSADSSGILNEHSLLASGSFNRDRIYKVALSGGASVTRYRGLPILVVQPFARERSEFNEVRWLAIPDSSLLFFGSTASVQQELDRHLDRSPADPRLVARLARLRRDDQTWCVLSLLTWTSDIRDSLAAFNPKLADLLKDGDTLLFGIHYGRQVEFEYEVTTASSHTTLAMSASRTQSFAGLEKGSTLFRSTDAISEGNPIHNVIKVPMARYNAWLTEVLTREKRPNPASPF